VSFFVSTFHSKLSPKGKIKRKPTTRIKKAIIIIIIIIAYRCVER